MTGETGEQALVFECAGERLLGLVSGARSGAEVGVLLVVGGPQYRVGSHRQFVLLARRLAPAGFPMMRFDYRGMGDSSGAMRPFDAVTPDIAAALDAFQAGVPSLERVVLWGLCDAASACLMYWQDTHDARVAGMVLADPWISSHEDFAKSQVRHYLRRPFQREFWAKLRGGGIDLGSALRDFAAVFARARTRAASPAAPSGMSFQKKMTRGMESFKAPVLLVLSGDLTARDFRQHCGTHPQWQRMIDRPNVDRGEIPEANHTFASAAARGRVEDMTLEWLRRHFGG